MSTFKFIMIFKALSQMESRMRSLRIRDTFDDRKDVFLRVLLGIICSQPFQLECWNLGSWAFTTYTVAQSIYPGEICGRSCVMTEESSVMGETWWHLSPFVSCMSAEESSLQLNDLGVHYSDSCCHPIIWWKWSWEGDFTKLIKLLTCIQQYLCSHKKDLRKAVKVSMTFFHQGVVWVQNEWSQWKPLVWPLTNFSNQSKHFPFSRIRFWVPQLSGAVTSCLMEVLFKHFEMCCYTPLYYNFLVKNLFPDFNNNSWLLGWKWEILHIAMPISYILHCSIHSSVWLCTFGDQLFLSLRTVYLSIYMAEV